MEVADKNFDKEAAIHDFIRFLLISEESQRKQIDESGMPYPFDQTKDDLENALSKFELMSDALFYNRVEDVVGNYNIEYEESLEERDFLTFILKEVIKYYSQAHAPTIISRDIQDYFLSDFRERFFKDLKKEWNKYKDYSLYLDAIPLNYLCNVELDKFPLLRSHLENLFDRFIFRNGKIDDWLLIEHAAQFLKDNAPDVIDDLALKYLVAEFQKVARVRFIVDY